MSRLANNSYLDLNNLFGGFYSTNASPVRRSLVKRPYTNAQNNTNKLDPRVDIIKQENGYQLIAELPGISKNQLSVTVEESTLTIETKPVNGDNNKTDEQKSTQDTQPQYLRRERLSGNFKRSFDLGQDIELSDIKASFKDGLLTLNIPKQKEQAPSTRSIDIH